MKIPLFDLSTPPGVGGWFANLRVWGLYHTILTVWEAYDYLLDSGSISFGMPEILY